MGKYVERRSRARSRPCQVVLLAFLLLFGMDGTSAAPTLYAPNAGMSPSALRSNERDDRGETAITAMLEASAFADDDREVYKNMRNDAVGRNADSQTGLKGFEWVKNAHSSTHHESSVNQAEELFDDGQYDIKACAIADLIFLVLLVVFCVNFYAVYKYARKCFLGINLYFASTSTPIRIAGSKIDDIIWHFRTGGADTRDGYPDPTLEHPDGWDEGANKGGAAATSGLAIADIKRHLKAIKATMYRLEAKASASGLTTVEDSEAAKLDDLEKIVSIEGQVQGASADGGASGLSVTSQNELRDVVEKMRGYTESDAAAVERVDILVAKGDVKGVRLAMAKAPTVMDVVEEQAVARDALEEAMNDRLRKFTSVSDQLSRMPLRDMDRFFAEGVLHNATGARLETLKKLERVRAFTDSARVRLAIAGDSSEEGSGGSDKVSVEIMELLKDYARGFLNPLKAKGSHLFAQQAGGEFPYATKFLTWQVLPAHNVSGEYVMREAVMSKVLLGPGRKENEGDGAATGAQEAIKLPDYAMDNARWFLEASAETKIRSEADYRFERALEKCFLGGGDMVYFKFNASYFDWEELTPGQYLKIAQLNLQTRFRGVVFAATDFVRIALLTRTIFSLSGHLGSTIITRQRCITPCEERSPDQIFKLFNLYIPGPACPKHGRALLDHTRDAKVALIRSLGPTSLPSVFGNLFQDILESFLGFGVSPSSFFAGVRKAIGEEIEEKTKPPRIIYTCLYTHHGAAVVPDPTDRNIGYTCKDFDFVSTVSGGMPTNCPPPLDANGTDLSTETSFPPSFLEVVPASLSTKHVGPKKAAEILAMYQFIAFFFTTNIVSAMSGNSLFDIFYSKSAEEAKIEKQRRAFGAPTYLEVARETGNTPNFAKASIALAVFFLLFGIVLMFSDQPIAKTPFGLEEF